MAIRMEVQWLWVLSLALLVGVQPSFSQPCTRRPGDADPDCSSVEAPNCPIPLGNGTFVEIMDPIPNHRSCYRTCISRDFFGFTSCQVNRTAFENKQLVRQRGPRDANAFSHSRLFSPGYRRGLDYRDNTLCRFNLLCNIEGDHTDAILTVTLQDHRLEAPQPQCGEGQDQCTDSVKLTLFGRICTTCGTGPLRCREQPDFPLLPSLIPISGGSRFLLQFKTNRDNETRGFQFLSQCVEKSYFSTTDCSIPDPPVQKRMMTKDTTMGVYFPQVSHRMRRGSRVVHITVSTESAVSYKDYTVRVFRGNTWLYKFPNIRYFQVYNVIEGYQTYCRDAPEGREFPGYGILKIGKGIVQYVQTGVEPEFIPSQAEAAIITDLYRRIGNAIDEPDLDTTDIYDEGERGAAGPTEIPPEEVEEMSRSAMRFGNACNGILRATACLYQALFREGGAGPECDP